MESSFQITDISLWQYVPEILGWFFGIILAVKMVRRGGGRTEKLFLAGCSLFFVARLAAPLLQLFLHRYLLESGRSALEIARMMGVVASLPLGILTLAGLACLVYAFWGRFRKAQVPA